MVCGRKLRDIGREAIFGLDTNCASDGVGVGFGDKCPKAKSAELSVWYGKAVAHSALLGDVGFSKPRLELVTYDFYKFL